MTRRLPFAIAVFLLGCKHAPETRQEGPILELALDEGPPSERPLTPSKTFELLMEFNPGLRSYRALRFRMLLAQGGNINFTVYGAKPEGGPGASLYSIERSYPPIFASNGKDGRWLVEALDLPPQGGPIWLGVWSPGGGNDPRLWATSNDSGSVYVRDPDPSTPLSSTRIKRTPIVRLEYEPAQESAPKSLK